MAAERLVIDASAATASLLAGDTGFDLYARFRLVAPPLLWSEVRSALHQVMWRGELTPADAGAAHARLATAPIRPHSPARLGLSAWAIAGEFGWAKTYDAEYLALGRLLSCRMVTLERRLHRRIGNAQLVIGPTEL